MKTTLSSLFIIVSCLTLTGCPTPMCLNPSPSYSFAVTAEFTPERDSIRLGDTLYLVSEFPSTMIPTGGDQPVDYSKSIGIGNKLGIVELQVANYRSVDAVYQFDYFNIYGRIYNSLDIPSPGRFQQLRYDEVNGRYILKIGMVPKKRGLYLIGIGDGLSNGRQKDKCSKASFRTVLTNNNPHLYLYEDWLGQPMEASATDISYLFKVY